MKGRKSFNQFKYLIVLLIIIFKWLPISLTNLIYSLTVPFEGLISVGIRYCIVSSMSKGRIGESLFIGRNVSIKNMETFNCGKNVSIHANCYIDAVGGIDIGDDVSIAHNSSLISFDHTWSDKSMAIKYNSTILGPIHIHSDVWVGCGVRILSNTTIQSRVVLAAGAVAKGNLLANSIYAGIPCKMIKDLS